MIRTTAHRLSKNCVIEDIVWRSCTRATWRIIGTTLCSSTHRSKGYLKSPWSNKLHSNRATNCPLYERSWIHIIFYTFLPKWTITVQLLCIHADPAPDKVLVGAVAGALTLLTSDLYGRCIFLCDMIHKDACTQKRSQCAVHMQIRCLQCMAPYHSLICSVN